MPDPQLPDIAHVWECCACGPGGLGLERWTDGERVFGAITLDRRHSGYSNTAHGGMIATFLDDLLGTVPALSGDLAVTGTLEIRYLKPGLIGRRYTLEAWLERREGRKFEIAGEMAGEDGVIAAARGTWIRVDDAHFAAMRSA